MSQYSFRVATAFLWASVSPSVIWAKSDPSSIPSPFRLPRVYSPGISPPWSTRVLSSAPTQGDLETVNRSPPWGEGEGWEGRG